MPCKETKLILGRVDDTVKNSRIFFTSVGADEVLRVTLERCKLPRIQKDKRFGKLTVERLKGLFL